MADRAAIFIDGAYFEFVSRDEFSEPRIDFSDLAKAMAGAPIFSAPTTIIARRIKVILQPKRRAIDMQRGAAFTRPLSAFQDSPFGWAGWSTGETGQTGSPDSNRNVWIFCWVLTW